MHRHQEMEIERQMRRILIVNASDRFYLRLPGHMPIVTDAIKALIPYERRHPSQGLGWMSDMQAWAFDYDDYADLMDLLQQLLPKIAAEEVAEFPTLDRSKPYELET
jgi:hypothetical protein